MLWNTEITYYIVGNLDKNMTKNNMLLKHKNNMLFVSRAGTYMYPVVCDWIYNLPCHIQLGTCVYNCAYLLRVHLPMTWCRWCQNGMDSLMILQDGEAAEQWVEKFGALRLPWFNVRWILCWWRCYQTGGSEAWEILQSKVSK